MEMASLCYRTSNTQIRKNIFCLVNKNYLTSIFLLDEQIEFIFKSNLCDCMDSIISAVIIIIIINFIFQIDDIRKYSSQHKMTKGSWSVYIFNNSIICFLFYITLTLNNWEFEAIKQAIKLTCFFIYICP